MNAVQKIKLAHDPDLFVNLVSEKRRERRTENSDAVVIMFPEQEEIRYDLIRPVQRVRPWSETLRVLLSEVEAERCKKRAGHRIH